MEATHVDAKPVVLVVLARAAHGPSHRADTMTNYLIPVDVADADLWSYSPSLNNIIEGLRAQALAATYYVVFDACPAAS
jgi:hypothetical protein